MSSVSTEKKKIDSSKVSQTVADEKYFLEGEDDNAMAERVGYFMGAAEKTTEDMNKWGKAFYELISGKKFVPGGRILANAGTYFNDLNKEQIEYLSQFNFFKNRKRDETRCGQMLNCYVIPVEDSKHGPSSIYESIEDAADITAMEGGVGENFSNIRPRGDSIRGNKKYKASGPLSFLKIFNESSKQLRQGGGRRGANMAVLNCDHPDIIDFITLKSDEITVTEYNISIGIYDDFINAVLNDEDWNLKFNGEVYRTVSARYLFDLFIKHAWEKTSNGGGAGEPGFLFLDTAARSWPFKHRKPITTNPCVTKDTIIMTDCGPKYVYQLINKKFNAVVDGASYKSISNGFFKTGEKKVYLLETHEGYSVKVTKDHKIFTSNNEKISADKLNDGDFIMLDSSRIDDIGWEGTGGTVDEGYLLGFLVGDGTFYKEKAILSCWFSRDEKDVSSGVKDIMNYIQGIMDKMPHRQDWIGWNKVPDRNEYRISSVALSMLADKYNIFAKDKAITEKIHLTSSDFQKGFLRGFFDADGSVQDGHNLNVRLTQNNLNRLKEVQKMLHRFGIVSKIYLDRKKNDSTGFVLRSLTDDRTNELVISKDNLLNFNKYIGFVDSIKNDRLRKGIESFVRGPYSEEFKARFKSLTEIGYEDVYDTTICDIHRYNANGLIISNCGEQYLDFYEACDLGAMNLYAYICESKTRSGSTMFFDFESFKEDITVAIRFLDNVLDLNNYPLKYRNDVSRKISMDNRRIGLGIMGLADTLMALGQPYGKSEFLETLMQVFDESSHKASVLLGKEKGSFLASEKSHGKFVGRRNCCVTTIAPTGTTSMWAGVWGGCEPFFGLVTEKKTTDGTGFEYYIVPDSFKKLLHIRGIDLNDERMKEIYNNKGSVSGLSWVPEDVQEICKTTMDISWEKHVEVQCLLQKYIENSISKTINLHNSATVKDAENAFLALWRGGAKGGTIYRDGSRELQIMNVGSKDNQDGTFTRSEILNGKTFKVKSKTFNTFENIYITINEDEKGMPVEVFIHNSTEVANAEYLSGLIGSGVPPEQAQMITDKISRMHKDSVNSVTRLVSTSLRNGVDIRDIVKQLNKINPFDIHNIYKRLAKILSSYIRDGSESEEKCEKCGGKLIYQESCLLCIVCGNSKCG